MKTENGWIVMPKDMGDYGVDYDTRADICFGWPKGDPAP